MTLPEIRQLSINGLPFDDIADFETGQVPSRGVPKAVSLTTDNLKISVEVEEIAPPKTGVSFMEFALVDADRYKPSDLEDLSNATVEVLLDDHSTLILYKANQVLQVQKNPYTKAMTLRFEGTHNIRKENKKENK